MLLGALGMKWNSSNVWSGISVYLSELEKTSRVLLTNAAKMQFLKQMEICHTDSSV
jgi:hypothetical protein